MNPSTNESGAALLVSLMLIFIMSTLGISAMKSATLEGRMVGNAYAKDLTFQAAESATDYVLADDANLEAVICTTTATTTNIAKLNANNVLTTTVDLVYGGETILVDNSLDSNFSAVRFTATGTSTIPNSSTRTAVSQGATLIGPKSMVSGC